MKALLLASAFALATWNAQAACDLELKDALALITHDGPHVVGEVKPDALAKWQDHLIAGGTPDGIRATKRMVIAMGKAPQPHADLVEVDAEGCVRFVSSFSEEIFIQEMDKVFGGSMDIFMPLSLPASGL